MFFDVQSLADSAYGKSVARIKDGYKFSGHIDQAYLAEHTDMVHIVVVGVSPHEPVTQAGLAHAQLPFLFFGTCGETVNAISIIFIFILQLQCYLTPRLSKKKSQKVS